MDRDQDGKISVSEFCTAMHLIRQAQQQEGGLLGSSQGVGFFQQGMGARQPSASLGPRQQSSGLVSIQCPSPLPQHLLLEELLTNVGLKQQMLEPENLGMMVQS